MLAAFRLFRFRFRLPFRLAFLLSSFSLLAFSWLAFSWLAFPLLTLPVFAFSVSFSAFSAFSGSGSATESSGVGVRLMALDSTSSSPSVMGSPILDIMDSGSWLVMDALGVWFIFARELSCESFASPGSKARKEWPSGFISRSPQGSDGMITSWFASWMHIDRILCLSSGRISFS
ncbi:hypothetical protein EGW08_018126, partial [Elysia chlorotica]